MNRFVVVFDNAPAEGAAWIARACDLANLRFVDNDPITTEFGKDPEARALAAKAPHDFSPFPEIGPYFLEALEKVAPAATEKRIGLHGVNWLVYGMTAQAVIVDFDPLHQQAEEGRKAKLPERDIQQYVSMFGSRVEQTAKKQAGAERVLILPRGVNDAQKAELAAAHIRKFDR